MHLGDQNTSWGGGSEPILSRTAISWFVVDFSLLLFCFFGRPALNDQSFLRVSNFAGVRRFQKMRVRYVHLVSVIFFFPPFNMCAGGTLISVMFPPPSPCKFTIRDLVSIEFVYFICVGKGVLAVPYFLFAKKKKQKILIISTKEETTVDKTPSFD